MFWYKFFEFGKDLLLQETDPQIRIQIKLNISTIHTLATLSLSSKVFEEERDKSDIMKAKSGRVKSK